MSFIFKWKQAPKVKRLAYGEIQREAPQKSPEGWYVWVRAQLILGNFDVAKSAIEAFENTDSFFKSFLTEQLNTLLTPAADHCDALWGLASSVPNDPYFQGEFHFFLGFAHNLANDFRSGVRHHRMAAEYYREAGLEGCAAIALYNTCIAYNHLNARSEYENTYDAFETLISENPLPSLKQLLLRIQAYRAIDQQDHAHAVDLLIQAFHITHAAGRWRDLGGICVHLEIESRLSGIDTSLPDYSSQVKSFSPNHQMVLREIQRLDKAEFPSKPFLRKTLRDWKTAQIESIFQLSLAQLLVEKISRGGDWETCLWLSRWASKTSLNHQQALCLWDFRYFEGVSLFHLGDRTRSARLMAAYQADSGNPVSRKRKERIESWGKLLQQSGNTAVPTLSLNCEDHSLSIGDRKIDLKRKPTIERFFQLLIAQEKPQSVEDFFEALYRMPYNSILHERRWNSIVDRARKILKHPDMIIRRSGHVGLESGVHAEIVGRIASQTVASRRKAILKALRKHPKAMPIAKLERKFPVSRRTLQSDLKFLIRKNKIVRYGNTRNCRYEEVKETQ